MLSAWDACYECDSIIQEAARGDLPNPDETLGRVGIAAAAFGYPGFLPMWAMISPTLALLGALSFIGGLTVLAIQRRRRIRDREDIVAGSNRSPVPDRVAPNQSMTGPGQP